MIKTIKICSQPEVPYMNRIYTKDNYEEVKNQERTQELLNTGMLSLVDFNLLPDYDFSTGVVDLRIVIGKVLEWNYNSIKVDIKEEYEDKYDWENSKAGMCYLANIEDILPVDSKGKRYSAVTINKIIAFHLVTPEEQKKIEEHYKESKVYRGGTV